MRKVRTAATCEILEVLDSMGSGGWGEPFRLLYIKRYQEDVLDRVLRLLGALELCCCVSDIIVKRNDFESFLLNRANRIQKEVKEG